MSIKTGTDYYNDLIKKLADGKKNISFWYNSINSIINVILIILIVYFFYKIEGTISMNSSYIILIVIGIIMLFIFPTSWLMYKYFYNTNAINNDLGNTKNLCHAITIIPNKTPSLQIENPIANSMMDLSIKDFYWASCYKPYRVENNGIYNDSKYMLKEAMDMGFRSMYLNVDYKNKKLVIGDVEGIDINEAFDIIDSKYTTAVPSVLVFNIKYGDKKDIHQKLYNIIENKFGSRRLGVSYSNNGLNGTNLINNLAVKDALGKYIIIFTGYPTSNEQLNYIVNGVMSPKFQQFNVINYSKSNEKRGITSNIVDIKGFKEDNKKYMNGVIPNKTEINVEDCNKYGINFCFLDLTLYKGETSNRTYNSILQFKDNCVIEKPKELIYFPPPPKKIIPQNKDLSYAPRKLDVPGTPSGFVPSFLTY